ncbi:MAG: lipopolysaccharide kinase InaA family protein [Gammaproteobacteria bacterium]|nr:lipopolysaccharide kinase InaA family protein [Gammaproteobacteria bacterium]
MNVTEEVFFSSESRARLETNHLADFTSLWTLDEEWFEKPNTRGQGFSGVVTRILKNEDGQLRRVFIKKQENHTTRSLAHPIKGIPTFAREYTNIVSLSALGVPTIELLYFGTAEHKARQRAILVSYALDEFTPVDEWFRQTRTHVSDVTAHAVIRALVAAIKPIHQAGYRHGCLYGKHIFIRLPPAGFRDDPIDDPIEVRVLDFEKAHRSVFLRRAILKDLSQFVRHCEKLTEADREYFMDRYFDEPNSLRARRFLKHEIGRKQSKS